MKAVEKLASNVCISKNRPIYTTNKIPMLLRGKALGYRSSNEAPWLGNRVEEYSGIGASRWGLFGAGMVIEMAPIRGYY